MPTENKTRNKFNTKGGKNGKFSSNSKKDFDSNSKRRHNCAPTQDPYWYAKDAEAIKAFASLPFVDVNGYPISDLEFSPNPGIFIFPYLPTIPGADTVSTSNYATRAADAYYQSIAQGFSANFDFEAPDLLMLEVAASGLFAILKEGRRAYGAMKLYLQNNAYWAKRIVESLGFQYDNLKENLKEFVAQYNLRIEAINKIVAAPKAFFIAQRWAYLSENIFTDANPLDYATAYAYRMTAVPEYDGTRLSTGTCLSYYHIAWAPRTVNDYFNIIDRLLNSLTGDDQRQMFGAIRRVYDASELITMDTLDSSYAITVYDSEIQSIQLHNTTLFDSANGFTLDNLGVPERPNIMMYQNESGVILANYSGQLIANSEVSDDWNQQVLSICGGSDAPENILDYTADMVPWGRQSDPARPGAVDIYPRAEIVLYPYVTTLDTVQRISPYHYASNPLSSSRFNIVMFARLNRAPHQYSFVNISGDGVKAEDLISELDKYTVVKNEYLRSTNTKCAYTLLALPLFAKSVT